MKAVVALAALAAGAADAAQIGKRLRPGIDGWAELPKTTRSALRQAVAKHISQGGRQLQADPSAEAWTTDHHDIANSGRSPVIGPADSGGSCRASFFKDQPCETKDGCPELPRYFSTGVGSAYNFDGKDYLYFGGTDNLLRIVSGSARVASAINTWTCNMSSLRPTGGVGAAPVSDFGIVGSPAAWDVAGVGDRLAVPSADGWLYVLNMATCVNDATVCMPAGNGKVGAAEEVVHAQALGQGVGVGEGAIPCLQAAVNLPGTRASLAPARYLTPAQSGTSKGLILLTASDPFANLNGILVAVDAGVFGTVYDVVKWTFDPAAALGVSTGLRGIVPALNAATGMLFVPVGQGLAVLNVTTGALITSIVDTARFDAFVASPVLTPAGDALLIHGASGAVYRFNLVYGAGNVTLTPVWSCDYTQAAWEAQTSPCKAAINGVLPLPQAKPWALRDGKGKLTGEYAQLPASAFVSGGAPRVSTADEVASFRASIVVEYEAMAGVGAAGRVAGETQDARLSYMLSQLSPTARERLGLASSISAVPELGDFPYATPALLPGDASFVLPQYVARDAGDTGLFTADVGTGAPLYAWFSLDFRLGPVNVSLPMGHSRSSPAVDGKGAVYFGADIDWPFGSGDDDDDSKVASKEVVKDTMPTLFAFRPANGTAGDSSLTFAWSWNMGEQADVPLGSASPIVRVGIYSDREVLMAAYDGAVSITEGGECPSADPVLECSGNGACDCATSSCACKDCYSGKDCADYDSSCDDNTPPLTPETIAGAVGLPLALVALGFIGYVANSMRKGRKWTSLLPTSVAKRLGVSPEYAPVPVAAGGASEGGSYGALSSDTSAAKVADWKSSK